MEEKRGGAQKSLAKNRFTARPPPIDPGVDEGVVGGGVLFQSPDWPSMRHAATHLQWVMRLVLHPTLPPPTLHLQGVVDDNIQTQDRDGKVQYTRAQQSLKKQNGEKIKTSRSLTYC